MYTYNAFAKLQRCEDDNQSICAAMWFCAVPNRTHVTCELVFSSDVGSDLISQIGIHDREAVGTCDTVEWTGQ